MEKYDTWYLYCDTCNKDVAIIYANEIFGVLSKPCFKCGVPIEGVVSEEFRQKKVSMNGKV